MGKHIVWIYNSSLNVRVDNRGADKPLARPGRKQANVFCQNGVKFLRRLALQGGGGKNLMTARVSMLLKSRASLACFRACFLPGRAKDLSAPQVRICFSRGSLGTLNRMFIAGM